MSPLAHLLRGVVRGYQLTFSSLLGRQCRFLPTCSHYAMEALETHGAVKGSALAFRRFLRCHPFAAAGYDPVPGTGSGPVPPAPPARDPARAPNRSA